MRAGGEEPPKTYWFSINDRGLVEDAPSRVYKGTKTAKPLSGLPTAFKAPLGALLVALHATQF